MSTLKLALIAVAAATAAAALAQEGPDLGVAATAEEIAGWDISISPDGGGLPPGSGTPAEGAEVFAIKCVACHGPQGEGLLNDRLVGGHGTLDTAAAVKTVGSFWPYATTVFDYVRRSMPYLQPHSLTNDEAYALTAHLLHLNGIIAADAELNATTLPEVEMPNRGNFVLAYPEAE
jgi:cytochrome c